jgi:hypothetical protein
MTTARAVARPQARPSAPRRDPTRRLAALAILAAALLPAGAVEHGPVVCPLRAATGIPCPACGITRSWRAALRGRPADSLRVHPLGLVALGFAAAYAAGLDERLSPGAVARLRGAWPIAVAGWWGVWLVRLATTARGRRCVEA